MRFYYLLVSLFIYQTISQANVIFAQFIFPSPTLKEFQEPSADRARLKFYGIGEIAGEKAQGNLFDDINSPSGRITLLFLPANWWQVWLSFNKGAGLNKSVEDTLRFKESIVFPETGSTTFQVCLGFPFMVSKNEDIQINLAPSLDFSYQKRNVTINNKSVSFDCSNVSFGINSEIYYYTSENRFRLILGINYGNIDITNNQEIYKQAFHNKALPISFSGFGFVAALQVNDVTLFAKLKNLTAHEDIKIDNVTGTQVIVGTSFAATIYSF